MNRLLLYGLLCALAPWLLAWLRVLFGELTRTLVYLLAAAQLLIVPVLVALDPDISFGSDGYSLGAGLGIVLIAGIEFVFLIGTALGLLLALGHLRRRERAEAVARVEAMFQDGPLQDPSRTA